MMDLVEQFDKNDRTQRKQLRTAEDNSTPADALAAAERVEAARRRVTSALQDRGYAMSIDELDLAATVRSTAKLSMFVD